MYRFFGGSVYMKTTIYEQKFGKSGDFVLLSSDVGPNLDWFFGRPTMFMSKQSS